MEGQPLFTIRDVIMMLTLATGLGGMWVRFEVALARLATKVEYVERAVNGGSTLRGAKKARAHKTASRRQ